VADLFNNWSLIVASLYTCSFMMLTRKFPKVLTTVVSKGEPIMVSVYIGNLVELMRNTVHDFVADLSPKIEITVSMVVEVWNNWMNYWLVSPRDPLRPADADSLRHPTLNELW